MRNSWVKAGISMGEGVMKKIDLGDGCAFTLYFDGKGKNVTGNLMGATWTPPQGGTSFWTVNGSCGDGYTDEEAIALIKDDYKIATS